MRIATLDPRFISLGKPRRLWAISAIHGEIDRLMAVHDALMPRLRPGDRIVYHGNYMGYGKNPVAVIDEILTFRRNVLALPGMIPADFIYLRGEQEEMWQKLLQLPFARNPSDVLLWMLGKGIRNTLESYGISPHDGIIAAQEGVMALTRWTGRIREAVRRQPGHDLFSTQWHRAAYTEGQYGYPLLFVNAGIDPEQPLEKQGDNFWWSRRDFNTIELPYEPFRKIIRGFDPAHRGLRLNCVTATIDGGCGFGGTLVGAAFDPAGQALEILQA